MSMDDVVVMKELRERYNLLYSAEKKVVDYILEHPQEVIMMNVSELAHKSNVSDATVVRTCQHAGFKGYYQMRLLMSRDLGQSKEIKRADAKKDPIGYVFEKQLEFLSALNTKKNKAKISRATKKIIAAEHVFIVAAGNTIPVALDLEFRLNRFGIRSFTSEISEQYMNYVNNAQARDVLIAISKSGISNRVNQAVELAKKRGVKIIALTGDETSLLAKLANCVVYTGKASNIFTRMQHGLETHIGEWMILDAILYKMEHLQKEDNIYDRNEELELEIAEYKM